MELLGVATGIGRPGEPRPLALGTDGRLWVELTVPHGAEADA